VPVAWPEISLSSGKVLTLVPVWEFALSELLLSQHLGVFQMQFTQAWSAGSALEPAKMPVPKKESAMVRTFVKALIFR